MSVEIPVVRLSDYLDGDDARRRDFIKTYGDAMKEFGFVRVRDHAVSRSMTNRAYDAARSFFGQPKEVKKTYLSPETGYQRGYTPFGKEKAKDTGTPDLKEFWHVGREFESVAQAPEGHAPNLWPQEVPEFKPAMLTLYHELDRCSAVLLEALALYLGEQIDRFTQLTSNGNSILRVIHYPPVDNFDMTGAIRSAAHEDINMITLLPECTSGGLELLTREGEWISVPAMDGEVVADTGDMIQRLTNGVIPATTHRVVNPDDGSTPRLSMPFFTHPRPECVLDVVESCREGDVPSPVNALEFMHERLRENGLL